MADADSYAYFDTSALAKRFVGEAGSRQVGELLRRHRVISSVLLQIELRSAVRRLRVSEMLSDRAVERSLRRIRSDAAAWRLVPVADDVVALACEYVLQHSLRTLDAIHVASADALRRQGLPLPFVTANDRQANAARASGFTVIQVDGRAR